MQQRYEHRFKILNINRLFMIRKKRQSSNNHIKKKSVKRKIKILDLFSGIGGFPKGFMRAGYEIEKHYYSEIDKHAIANYKNNFKDSIYAGSVENIRSGYIERPDVITFGSPCQDFSLAGKRKGMGGERSSLILEAIRLVSELRPSVFIWENVKGAFSSNDGADFWAILQAFANIGGYRLEWQLLNTVWFLPQNRERIYLVGHLAGRSELGVFPIEENDGLFKPKGESEKRRSQTKYSSTTLRAGNMKASDTFINIPKIAGCLTGGGNSGGMHSDMTTIQIGAIRGRNPDNPSQRIAGQYQEQTLEFNSKGVSNTLTSAQKDNVVIHQRPRGKNQGGMLNVCPTISSNSFQHNNHILSYTRDKQGKVVNRNMKSIANTIHSSTGMGGNTDQYVGSIRRLTEIECERLQGFPDNWTEYGVYDGKVKKTPKTQRYKMLGNAVTVDVVEAVARRIKIKKI